MQKIKYLSILLFTFGAVGCFKDLDTQPLDPDVLTASNVYKDPAAYKAVLAKLYAGFSVSGQQDAAGLPDIAGIDIGFGQYLRGFWYHQEFPTDEAVVGWNDQTIKDFHYQTWTSSDVFVYAFYSRVCFQIAQANEYLRETADAKLAERGASDALKNEVKTYRAEARFLRALSWWHALDVFRNPPFADENDVVGAFVPTQRDPQFLFSYIESELKAIENDLAAPRTNQYGRADRAAAWMLLAKLYLNAEAYIGQAKYAECLAECEKILSSGYTLDPSYKNLFLADNNKSPEIIFPITFDGVHTRTWGGTTFIIRAGIGGSMKAAESGVAGGWAGTRTTRQLVEKFPVGGNGGIVSDFNPGKTAQYSKIYVPGSHQGWNAEDTDNALASPVIPSNKIFEGYKYFPAGTEIRFAQYPSNTAPYLGDNGADGKLETNGANIAIPEAGLYFLKVDLAAKTYTLEKQSWALIGSATGGSEIALQWDAAAGMLYAAAPLVPGTFKFRGNGSDALNFGDAAADGLLERNGAEIAIATGDNYKIFLDLDKPDYTYQLQATSYDRRPMFHSDGQNLDIDNIELFTEGYAINKFKNVRSDGTPGSDTDFPDTDFPMFRLADVYLMAAECLLRTNGDKNLALSHVNAVRQRAYGGALGNFTAAQLTLDALLDERARELYWEGHRRTDLVRFGKFTDGSYVWAWKGNVKEGKATEAFRNIYPLPTQDIGANPGLRQNPGY